METKNEFGCKQADIEELLDSRVSATKLSNVSRTITAEMNINIELLETKLTEMTAKLFVQCTNNLEDHKRQATQHIMDHRDLILSYQPSIKKMLVADDLKENNSRIFNMNKRMDDEFEQF
jgi:hypothetical protein